MVHLLRCVLALAAVVLCEGETAEEKTTEVVVAAVAGAANSNASEKQKEAIAVADATLGVIEAESTAKSKVAPEVITKAKDEAKQTFEQLKHANADTKVAADAAAKVAIAEVDGTSGFHIDNVVKENAEKAAVATADGLAEHPGNEAKAISEAVVTIHEEEMTPGAADLKEKGVLTKAEEVVSALPSDAKNRPVGAVVMLMIFVVFFSFGSIVYQKVKSDQPSEYMRKIHDVEEGRDVLLQEADADRMYAALG